MALSGSFSGSIRSGKYQLRVDWSATQSVANNTSKITCAMYLVQASGWSLNISARSGNTTTIAGSSSSWSSPAINNGGGKTTKLASVTSGNISHNADGTKSVTISATFKIEATISGTYYGTITASQTVTLNTIPRATTPKLSTNNIDMGGKVTISTPRASSSFTHELGYKLSGSTWTTIATGVGTSYTWTVPDLANQVLYGTSAVLTVRCMTKNGSTLVGTKTVSLVVKVPASVVPTIGTVTLAETVAGLAAQFGAFVKGKSKVKATITASGAKGSTIKTITTTFGGTNYTGASWTSAVLTQSGTRTATVKVTDSRGRTASKSVSYTVLDYSAPNITTLNAYRTDANGNTQDDGLYMSVNLAYVVASVGGKNTAAMRLDYKRVTESNWSSTPLITGSSLSEKATRRITGLTFSTDYQYDLRLTVEDWFGATDTYYAVLPSGEVILDLAADGHGIAFGKTSEQPGLEFGWPVVNQSAFFGNLSGEYQTHDGLLIQWGTVNITPTAANVATTAVVKFPEAYGATPTVFVTPISSVPGQLSVSVQRNAEVIGAPNTEGIAVTLLRENTTATGINWVAIGKAAPAATQRALLMDADDAIVRDSEGAYIIVGG